MANNKIISNHELLKSKYNALVIEQFKNNNIAFNNDAETISKILKLPLTKTRTCNFIKLPKYTDLFLTPLVKAGYKIALAQSL
jgi:hypothetical protein